MNIKKQIHNLISERNYLQLYKEYPFVLNKMLCIENQEEFERTYFAAVYCIDERR